MTRILERRLRRLEQARGAQDEDELVEVRLELSPAGRAQLEETLAMMKQHSRVWPVGGFGGLGRAGSDGVSPGFFSTFPK